MARETIRGVMHREMVAVSLADGTEVLVTPLVPEPGTPAGVLAALEATPPVPTAWMNELEQIIAQGQRPPARRRPVRGSARRARDVLMAVAWLDTHAVSDLMRDNPRVKARVAAHAGPLRTSVVAGEVRYGLDGLPAAKKRHDPTGPLI